MLRAQRAQRLQEGVRRPHEIHVADDGFDDHAGDIGGARGEHALQRGHVVVGQHEGVLGEIGRHAARGWVAESQRARAGLDEQAVGMAVVATLELDDRIAAGEAARQPDRAHRRLGARGDEPDHFHIRHELAEQFGHVDLDVGRCAEREPEFGFLLHRADHVGVRMAEDRRTPGADVIDVFAAIDIPDSATFCAGDEARRAADGAEGAYGRVHASGNGLLGAVEKRLIAVCGHLRLREWF